MQTPISDATPSEERQEYLERQPTYWLKRCYQALRRRVDDELRPSGISLSQRECLLALFHDGPLNQGKLVDRLRLEQSSVSRLVDGLQRREWVTVDTDENDRRSRLVFITSRGRQVLEQTPGAAHIAGPLLGQALSQTEQDELIRLLSLCAAALEMESDGNRNDQTSHDAISSRARGNHS